MRNFTKLFLLAVLFVFASCQNETLTEGASSIVEEELAMEDEILVSDGEEDETFVLNDESEIMPTRALKFTLSSNSTSEGPRCTPDIEAVELNLPDTVTVETLDPECNTGYFQLNISEGDLAGEKITAWCSDMETDLDINETVTYDVYSSSEDLSGINDLFANADKFDEVNWLLNQSFKGQESGITNAEGENYVYTFGHIQSAIWKLIDGKSCSEENLCFYLTCPTYGEWSSDDELMSDEIVAAAEAQDGFIPGCGQQIAVILASSTKQSLIITTEVPEKEVPCSDCEGKVTKLELEFDWKRDKYIKIYQRKENTCYGVKIFSKKVKSGETFTIEGANHYGTIGKYAYIYINGCYYTKIKTNCDTKIGPGYTKGVFNVISGESSHGGELCEYVKPDYKKCYRHWGCKYYSKCRYTRH